MRLSTVLYHRLSFCDERAVIVKMLEIVRMHVVLRYYLAVRMCGSLCIVTFEIHVVKL